MWKLRHRLNTQSYIASKFQSQNLCFILRKTLFSNSDGLPTGSSCFCFLSVGINTFDSSLSYKERPGLRN